MANFMTEQLDADMKRQEKVKNGEMTQRQADELADRWETVRPLLRFGNHVCRKELAKKVQGMQF